MELSSIHIHTSFCDGKGEPEDFCAAAVEKGFKSIGFSAHAPFEKKTGIKTSWHLKDKRFGEYIDTLDTLKRRWEGKLKIYTGLEVDFVPGLIAPRDTEWKAPGIDYIIGSVHFVVPPRGEIFTIDGPPDILEKDLMECFGGDREALVNAYWDSVEAMIRGGGFDVLAHIDLIKKNNAGRRLFDPESEYYGRRSARAIDLAAQYGITVELNTGGMNRKKIDEPYPSPLLLKRARQKNIPVVINSDAHEPGDIDGHYPGALKAMRGAGYEETFTFAGKQDGKARWLKVKLSP